MYRSAGALLLVLATAVFFRTYRLTTTPPGLYFDEAMDGANAQEALRTGEFKVFYPENNGREGLHVNIVAFFLRLIRRNEPWVLRLPSALFGVLTVLGVYLLGREMFRDSRPVALLAALFMATSFWQVNFSRIANRAILAPCFLAWSVFLLLLAFRRLLESADPRRSFHFFVLAGLVYGLGFHSYIPYRATPLLILLILILFWFPAFRADRSRHFITATLLFVVTAAAVVFPLARYFMDNPESFTSRVSQLSIVNSPTPIRDLALNVVRTLGMFFEAVDRNWRHNYPGVPELNFPVAVCLAFGMWAVRKAAPAAAILLVWLVTGLLPGVLSTEGVPHSIRTILMAPAVFLLAGCGAVSLGARLAGKKRALAAVVLAVIVVLHDYALYFVAWARSPELNKAFAVEVVAVARQLKQLPDDRPKYIVVDAPGIENYSLVIQPIVFLTGTSSPEEQRAKGFHYVSAGQAVRIPPDAFSVRISTSR